MDVGEILKALALAQGSFAFGITLIIFYYYFRPFKGITPMRQHIILISVSYLLLMAATMISIFRDKYEITDWWNLIVGVGYIIGDISLFILFKQILKKEIYGKG